MGGAACAKIILNGKNGGRMLLNVVSLLSGDETLEHADEIIKRLNTIEEEAAEVQKLILKDLGYEGPLPWTMDK